jgi:hypothetical protein
LQKAMPDVSRIEKKALERLKGEMKGWEPD